MNTLEPGRTRRIGPTALRLLVVLVSFGLSGVGVLIASAFFANVLAEEGVLDPWMLGISLIMCYSWIAWLVLAHAWVVRKRLHVFWPISGLVSGGISVLCTLGLALLYVFPAFLMAMFFVIFQFDQKTRSK